MLEKPNIQDTEIIACLRDQYGLTVAQLDFLPRGADRDTAVYRAAVGSTPYFVKLRKGAFSPLTLTVPKLLHDQGVTQVIAPLVTQTGKLWAPLEVFHLAVFPFIAGRDGYDVALTDAHWIAFGRALKAIHAAKIKAGVLAELQHDAFQGFWRTQVQEFMERVETEPFSDPIAAELATLLRDRRKIVEQLVARAEELAAALTARSLPVIVCHADLHAGNLLIADDGRLFIIDWDMLIRAPKERDLMFVGGGLFGGKRSPREEEALFYRGYGAAEIDAEALVYYRYERIVDDIAAYCEAILLTEGESQDRANGLRQLTSQFQPGAVIDVAFRSEGMWGSL